MNVLLISQCSKRALTESRRILDQFAERRGDRVWQTAITRQGLEAVYRLLRRTARRNTAVACHWIRGLNHSELLWVVGDASRFNAQGAVPTNETQRDVLRSDDENDWHSGDLIRLLAALAALFHDFGKASDTFQNKLAGNARLADVFRHEWVSLRLFEAFVRAAGAGDDRGWLQALAALTQDSAPGWLQGIVKDTPERCAAAPLRGLPPLARIVGWLIVSHHRLPTQPRECPALPAIALQNIAAEIRADWCSMRRPDPDAGARARKAFDANAAGCWTFGKGLPDSASWRRHAARLADALLGRLPGEAPAMRLDDDYVLHLARLALMLADHQYSAGPSLPRYGDAGCVLFANTDRASGRLKQRLDEHLIGVAVSAGRIVRSLPRLALQLPRIARHRGLRKRSADRRFAWQDHAFELAESLRERSAQQGFFGINLASTGCGKTRANARILYALADPQRGARFTVALGLRTLTLQTGEVYRSEYGLGDEDLAVLVGSAALRELHESSSRAGMPEAGPAETGLERQGCESAEALFAGAHVHFSGSLEDGPLDRWLADSADARRLLAAPVLACTIDHLMPATEGTRGGRQIAPMLRLLTADLILDEPDDFGTEDLPALCRLVHWAGLLGARVLLSSATLPPALVQALFDAYRSGRGLFRRNRGQDSRPLPVCCAWFDEFGCRADTPLDTAAFAAAHARFVDHRLGRLDEAPTRRSARIVPLSKVPGLSRAAVLAQFAQTLREQAPVLHARHHAVDPRSGSRVSFGLIRMAHIDELFEVARVLSGSGGDGWHLHLCVYHSRHPLLLRARIEHTLDRLLKRHPDPETDQRRFADRELRGWIDAVPAPDHLFVVLATAVAEVGRDHDYDWAIVEPSSMRSIIQLAGRVRRHRPGPCTEPNLALLETNLSHLLNAAGEPAFTRPGFEGKPGFLLRSHGLGDLLTEAQLRRIDAAPRLREPEPLRPAERLADLEHARLRDLLLAMPVTGQQQQTPANLWWTTRATLSGACQKYAPFRNDPLGRQRFVVYCPQDGGLHFRRIELGGVAVDTDATHLFEPVSTPAGPQASYWGAADYRSALEALAETLVMESDACARRYGTLDLPVRSAEQGWRYDEVLGCVRRR